MQRIAYKQLYVKLQMTDIDKWWLYNFDNFTREVWGVEDLQLA